MKAKELKGYNLYRFVEQGRPTVCYIECARAGERG